ncbi:MAG: hypothetical protein PF569_08745 [Candidatus Woesearchaeota archaeon]|jgi:hypothetical protein|nr:hypothetical protein [Candidatus Woesearchaeota archaeon]
MATIDNGSQILSYDFKNPGQSESFNRINYKVRSEGIYEGGVISKINDNLIEISPFIAHINDPNSSTGVRLETTANANVSVTSTTPFIIVRFIWNNIANNYASILAVAETDILGNDLIIGKLIYNGSTMTVEYDYSRKSWASFVKLEEKEKEFAVYPTEPYTNQVSVSAGTAMINGKYIDFNDSLSPVLTDVATYSRIDILVLDETGTLVWVEGVTDISPVVPTIPTNVLPLAMITRDGSFSVIYGNHIKSLSLLKTI